MCAAQELGEKLKSILADTLVWPVLPAIAKVGLPDCWLAGGAVRNTVWKALYPGECQLGIKDFDVVFFDVTGNREQELKAKGTLQSCFPQEIFDVKNQASFGVWRPWPKTFTSTANGVSNWLHTATAVGIRISAANKFEILAPHGLSDLFDGIVRPCPSNIDNPAALEKALTFKAACPALRLLS